MAYQRGILRTVPQHDALFRLIVRDALTGVRGKAISLEAARRKVRVVYPAALLYRWREALRDTKSIDLTVAVRDGESGPAYQPERWWLDRGVAHAIVDRRGRVIDINARGGSLLGRHGSALGSSEAPIQLPQPIIRVVRQEPTLMRLGHVTSTVQSDGQGHAYLDYHLVWNSAGERRHGLWLRSEAERHAAATLQAVQASSLASLSRDTRSTLLRGAHRRQLDRGDRLGDPMHGNDWAALVVAGVVRIYASGESVDRTVTYGRHGSLLGTHTGFAHEADAVGLQAITPSVVIQLSPERIRGLIHTDGAFNRAVLDDVRRHLAHIVRTRVVAAATRHVQRLASELLVLDRLQGTHGFLLVTEQQLADALGSLRESVGRSIRSLREMGAIATTRQAVLILDGGLLRAIASGSRGATHAQW